ncbi:MAG: peptidase M16 [Bacteroidetes bacterium GWF2_42_66]|nr:MAG: peptidase M16 [Bacteroidetes bacterium GWA2_42_15]OFX98667.1 MAG: peptidase M16 [Bacteroidetes bacterium GWE2_42_39]OFY43135.1 MAG: peptidase M16 [Bacteroidetes bacterium GWF2_42_66]HBL77015.1 peptidase M16 [Prolixibacteraceae bacterium]HCR90106.1 peptidase M16 [Prolixibacteraceae bacterium]
MINFEKYILDNGLTVIVHQDKTTPMVAIDVCYKVGSRDEDPARTGFAHLFEHLMFGGSKHIPSYDEPLQKAGGDNNAYTTNDLTNYYLTVPKVNMETGFWLESDRMLELAFSQKSLDVQKNVVIEEFKQRNLNQPYGDVWALIRGMAYQVHPYRWATIGQEISHIENATLSHVKDFFYHHYAPNNAVLVVTGDITSAEVMKLAEKWFSTIPARELAPKNIPVEPPQTAYREQTVYRDVPNDALYMAFHMADRLHPDYYATDMISDVLSNGNSSRLYQRLVQEKKIFTTLDAYISGDYDPGLFIFSGNPSEGIDLEEARAELENEIELIKLAPVDARELEKVKNKFEANLIYSEISYQNKAQNLATLEVLKDAALINTQMDGYRAVSATDIQMVASHIFVPENCSVLYYRAKKQKHD